MRITDTLKSKFIAIVAFLTKASKALVAAILPVLEADLSTLLAEILPIAEQVVINLATSGQSGKEKQAAAFNQIKTAALAAGIQATTQAINIAIELAVANLPKASTGTVSGTTTPPPAAA